MRRPRSVFDFVCRPPPCSERGNQRDFVHRKPRSHLPWAYPRPRRNLGRMLVRGEEREKVVREGMHQRGEWSNPCRSNGMLGFVQYPDAMMLQNSIAQNSPSIERLHDHSLGHVIVNGQKD